LPDRALVIVPTYNEKQNIERMIDAILKQDASLDVLVVDDGSPDGTGEIVDRIAASNPRVFAIHRAGKLGLGTAYVAGFKWALARDYQFVFEMDADFSHAPEKLPTFLEAIQTADLVIGSRYQNGQVNVVNWPIGRLFLSYSANIYARRITGLPIFDSTAGF
jgi:dolichol-phosphate mannosyltransferase